MWIRRDDAFEPIIPPEIFKRAQEIVDARYRRYSDDEMLELLRRLLAQKGTLSGILIDEAEGLPSRAAYQGRVQKPAPGLPQPSIGYAPTPRFQHIREKQNRLLREQHRTQIEAIISELKAGGATVRRDPTTDTLTVNDEFTTSLVLARCRETQRGNFRWVMRLDASLAPDITIGAPRLAAGNESILDYYLFPSIDALAERIRLAPENGFVLDVYRFDDLSFFFSLCRRQTIEEDSMKTQRIELIPISEIRVANPRSRNKVTFQTIVTSIDKVGLKKPVTLSRRDADTDGTHYDLVCGSGRLEAVAALGDTTVPAIVIDAPPKKRSIMSLIENVARRRPSNWEPLAEVRSLKERGYKSKIIAEKIGFDVTYIDGIILLLRKGEEKLIAQVEAGTLPLSVAMKIAGASNQEVQQALAEAYDKGDLRGEKLRAVQRLITQRFAKDHSAGSKPERKVTGKDLVREYERYVQRQKTLLRRASVISQRLALLVSTLKRLRSDEHFVTLLRAESLEKLPEALSKAFLV